MGSDFTKGGALKGRSNYRTCDSAKKWAFAKQLLIQTYLEAWASVDIPMTVRGGGGWCVIQHWFAIHDDTMALWVWAVFLLPVPDPSSMTSMFGLLPGSHTSLWRLAPPIEGGQTCQTGPPQYHSEKVMLFAASVWVPPKSSRRVGANTHCSSEPRLVRREGFHNSCYNELKSNELLLNALKAQCEFRDIFQPFLSSNQWHSVGGAGALGNKL